jgi:hypothetical protein
VVEEYVVAVVLELRMGHALPMSDFSIKKESLRYGEVPGVAVKVWIVRFKGQRVSRHWAWRDAIEHVCKHHRSPVKL